MGGAVGVDHVRNLGEPGKILRVGVTNCEKKLFGNLAPFVPHPVFKEARHLFYDDSSMFFVFENLADLLFDKRTPSCIDFFINLKFGDVAGNPSGYHNRERHFKPVF